MLYLIAYQFDLYIIHILFFHSFFEMYNLKDYFLNHFYRCVGQHVFEYFGNIDFLGTACE